MRAPLDDRTLETLFRTARTANAFLDEPVAAETWRELLELAKWGPTSMNCQPARFVFVTSPEAKARLQPALSEGNRDKSQQAAATLIVAFDTRFYEHMPRLAPHAANARDSFAGHPDKAHDTALRNTALQAGYLIMAARMLGLDVGPMSGFDAAAVNAEFFPDGRYRADLLVNLGVADPEKARPRGPRFAFDEVAEVV
ncbi:MULTISPECIES: malonic semialdehyde reductase [Halomonadaceae]|uniref:malonic semialdehyde reductase n=1 Tax=Halomonadaceae TaxID=28256 RepID=UPI001598366C|nr:MULTISPECIES: malonic semialdehyde reductase [Halomonas]QJQ93886.1 malonic semialdehyde reductase [Halomonas sp. PA5]